MGDGGRGKGEGQHDLLCSGEYLAFIGFLLICVILISLFQIEDSRKVQGVVYEVIYQVVQQFVYCVVY